MKRAKTRESDPHSGAVIAGCAHRCAHVVCQVSSPGSLVQLAQPDFSMPYNVACMTCTMLALFLGGLSNTLFRWAAWHARRTSVRPLFWHPQTTKPIPGRFVGPSIKASWAWGKVVSETWCLARRASEADMTDAQVTAVAAKRKRRAIAIVIVFSGAAFYLDKGLRRDLFS